MMGAHKTKRRNEHRGSDTINESSFERSGLGLGCSAQSINTLCAACISLSNYSQYLPHSYSMDINALTSILI